MEQAWHQTSKWRVFFAIGLSYIVIVLSTSLTFILLSPIAEHFNVSLAAVGWVVIIEGLAIAALLLPVGGLADSFGRRRVLIGGLVLFGVGALSSGLAPTFALLIVARLVMSLGNMMVQAVSTGLLVAAFPPAERGIAMGAQTSAVAVGAASGPFLGGLLLRSLAWSTLFLLLVVPTIASIGAAYAFLPDDRANRTQEVGDRFVDYRGSLLSAAAVVLLIVLISNPFELALASAPPLGAAALFVVLTASFVRWELAHDQPMIQLRLFSNATFRTAVLVRFFGFVASAAITILLPIYLVSVRDVSNAVAGVVIALNAVGIGLSAQLAGRLYDRIGPRWPTIAGLGIQGICVAVLAVASTATPVWLFAVLAFGAGVGQSQWNVPNNSAMMGATSRDSLGVVGAFTNVARTMGSVVGQALAAAVVAAVMVRQGFDIPLADVGDVVGASASFVEGWTAAFVLAVVLLVVAVAFASRLPHGSPEAGSP